MPALAMVVMADENLKFSDEDLEWIEKAKNPLNPSNAFKPLSNDPSSTMRNQLKFPPGAACPSSSAASVPCLQAPLKQDSFPMNSQWKKGKLIGCGRFGRVYVAINSENGALLCAMKEVDLFPDDPQSADCVNHLEQELKLLSNLQHPNIVQYFGCDREEDRFFIYLEYVHPGSLKKYIHDHGGTLTESVVCSFTRHILSGLAYLHSKKIVHRDIKGANLLVDASGVVKLADFGVAKLLTGQRAELSLKGSPYWMAPELMQAVMQKDSNPDLAFAVDIWSLGCTIIEMFTGKPPWIEFEGQAAMFKALRESPPIPESMSPEGKDFLRLCFKRKPAERPTASMLLEHRFLKNSLQPTSPNNNDSPVRFTAACGGIGNFIAGRCSFHRRSFTPACPCRCRHCGFYLCFVTTVSAAGVATACFSAAYVPVAAVCCFAANVAAAAVCSSVADAMAAPAADFATVVSATAAAFLIKKFKLF